MKIGRNGPCPCGRLTKYKHCCLARGIDFGSFNKEQYVKHLTARGKNIMFLDNLMNILDLKNWPPKNRCDLIIDVKRSLTPEKVRSIHQAIPQIWPDKEDYYRCLQLESDRFNGLFIGDYLVDSTVQLMNKYGLYEDSILLIDPIVDHRRLKPEISPIEHPEIHMVPTLNSILIWLQFAPWIIADVVKFIGEPTVFDKQLRIDAVSLTEERCVKIPEYTDLNDDSFILDGMKSIYTEMMMCMMPNDQLIQFAKDSKLDAQVLSQYIKKERLTSPYYIEGYGNSQLLRFNSGTNYEIGKHICTYTNSHILTDLKLRWKEIEFDRKENKVKRPDWEPFSQVLQSLNLNYLNGLQLEDILSLRQDGYLDNMRDFLRKLWLRSSSSDDVDSRTIELMGLELKENIHQADSEWKKIDFNLLAWFGMSGLGASLETVIGNPSWIPPILMATAGVSGLVYSSIKRAGFMSKYPAAFFLESQRKSK